MDRTLQLIKKVQEGDEKAKELIIAENQGLVWSVARRFLNRGYEADDLFQIGAIGLLKSVYKFNLNYDVKFSTYAVPMIMGEIKRFLRDDGMIKVSRHLKELSIRAKFLQEKLTSEHGAPPTINELASALEVSSEDLVMALDAGREVESLYQTVHRGEREPVFLIDKLSEKDAEQGSLDDNIAIRQVIASLKPKEQQIVFMRYFHDKTQSEIAKEIGVSQVQISRLEKRILKTMRERFG
ncbi:MAG: RNA polymerase sporulation sigma factor SigF [Defluviitaleaceae bacterium]|nr:RNA polymerase sporulation sigma factor SigF [Defluviitaleaceae bacterium]